VLALPPPSAGPPPPSATQPGTRPPFITPTGVGGVGNMPPMGIGRGVVNGTANSCPANVAPPVSNQPSMTDIAAGALLIASVVQGQLICLLLFVITHTLSFLQCCII